MIHSTLSFQITWDCDAKCVHCFQNHQNYNLSIELTKELINSIASKINLSNINFTGGEPFLKYNFLKKIIHFNKSLNLKSRIITNCKWCDSKKLIYKRLHNLTNNNLDLIVISYDYFHSQFIPYNNILMLVNICNEIGLKVILFSTLSPLTEKKTKYIISNLQNKTNIKVIYRWLIPINSKLQTNDILKIEDLFDCCSMQNIFTIWPNGEVLPCCSVGTSRNLSIGNINHDTIEDLLNKRYNNNFLKILEHEGPKGVYYRLPDRLKIIYNKKTYVNRCHLCNELFNNNEIHNYLKLMKWEDIDIVDKILQ